MCTMRITHVCIQALVSETMRPMIAFATSWRTAVHMISYTRILSVSVCRVMFAPVTGLLSSVDMARWEAPSTARCR